jgi:hypothetical protein
MVLSYLVLLLPRTLFYLQRYWGDVSKWHMCEPALYLLKLKISTKNKALKGRENEKMNESYGKTNFDNKQPQFCTFASVIQ